MWEQVKWAVVESAREVCGSVREEEKNPKREWWNYDVKAVVKRKMLSASDEESKERCMKVKIKVKRCIYQSKKKVNEPFGRKVIEDVNRNRKLFWKEVSNAKEGKMESCSRIKDGNGRLAEGEDEMQKI